MSYRFLNLQTEIAMHKRCNSRRLHKQQQLLSEKLDFEENILIISIFIIRSSTSMVMLCWSWNNRTWLMCLIDRKRICITVCSRIDLSFRKLKWNRYNSYRIVLATSLEYFHRSSYFFKLLFLCIRCSILIFAAFFRYVTWKERIYKR